MIKRELTIMSIIENTIQLLRQKEIPFEALSVSDICQTNSITKPTFYKYIGSKEAILQYYFRIIFHQLADQYLQKSYSDPKEELWAGISLYADCAIEMGVVLYRSFIATVLKNNIEPDPLQRELIERILKAYDEICPAIPFEELFAFCQQQLFGMSYYWVMTDASFNLQRAFKNQFFRFLGENLC